GLGIIVDDAIVVIENTHRIFAQGKGRLTAPTSAMMAAGEVFIPVLAGTLTTLAPFFPLLFWPGIIGKFMIYLPTVLILTLTASLIVAFLINPVFAVSFMKPEHSPDKENKSAIFRKKYFWVFLIFGLLLHGAGMHGLANFILLLVALIVFNRFVLRNVVHGFQQKALPRLMNRYEKALRWGLKGSRPGWLVASVFGLFIISGFALYTNIASGRIKTDFFPSGDPNIIYVYLKMPV